LKDKHERKPVPNDPTDANLTQSQSPMKPHTAKNNNNSDNENNENSGMCIHSFVLKKMNNTCYAVYLYIHICI
jgi:hypothetical protein